MLRWLAARCSMIGLAAVLLLPFSGVAQPTPEKGDTVTLPALTLLSGQQRPDGYYTGKPVIVFYWASWCPFCARQSPYVQKLYDNAQDTGLEVLSISIDEDDADAHTYIQDKGYTFPVAMETSELRDVLGKRRIIPAVFAITADGKVAEVIPGEMFEEDVLELIKYAPDTAQ